MKGLGDQEQIDAIPVRLPVWLQVQGEVSV